MKKPVEVETFFSSQMPTPLSYWCQMKWLKSHSLPKTKGGKKLIIQDSEDFKSLVLRTIKHIIWQVYS